MTMHLPQRTQPGHKEVRHHPELCSQTTNLCDLREKGNELPEGM